jgi:exopolyphosphatase / guanosine-5'-triphosphate,3'-diphosphate pyrophosphatase
MSVRRVAAIDCGTNSIRLLVADVDAQEQTLTDIAREMRIVRLGEGVDRTGEFTSGAIERTLAACDEYASLIAASKPMDRTPIPLRFVATSASRDARNRSLFIDGVQSRLGVAPEVVSGAEEALLSYTGATRELSGDEWAATLQPALVVDLGGGSTEFVMQPEPAESLRARSVDVGCVRMTERHMHSDPPTPDQVAAVRADVDTAIALAAQDVPIEQARSIIGLAGTVTTVVALALGLEEYDAKRIHLARVSTTQVHEVTERLIAMTTAQRAALGVMHPGRADVIAAGALIIDRIMFATGLPELIASEHDILDGIAWSLVQ